MISKTEKAKIEDRYNSEKTPYDDLLKLEKKRVHELRSILTEAEEGIVHYTDQITKWKENNSNN